METLHTSNGTEEKSAPQQTETKCCNCRGRTFVAIGVASFGGLIVITGIVMAILQHRFCPMATGLTAGGSGLIILDVITIYCCKRRDAALSNSQQMGMETRKELHSFTGEEIKIAMSEYNDPHNSEKAIFKPFLIKLKDNWNLIKAKVPEKGWTLQQWAAQITGSPNVEDLEPFIAVLIPTLKNNEFLWSENQRYESKYLNFFLNFLTC